MQKPVQIIANGRMRPPRHLFLPKCWTYKSVFELLAEGHTATGFLAKLSSTPTTALPFEIP